MNENDSDFGFLYYIILIVIVYGLRFLKARNGKHRRSKSRNHQTAHPQRNEKPPVVTQHQSYVDSSDSHTDLSASSINIVRKLSVSKREVDKDILLSSSNKENDIELVSKLSTARTKPSRIHSIVYGGHSKKRLFIISQALSINSKFR